MKITVSYGRCHFNFQVLLVFLTHGHWVTCKINLKAWVIYIYDSLAHNFSDEPWFREYQIIPLRAILLSMLEQAGYFQHTGMSPRKDMFRAKRLPLSEVEKQEYGKSCEMFYLRFINYIVSGLPIPEKVTQANIEQL